MKSLRSRICSLWWGPIVCFAAFLFILVSQDAHPRGNTRTFDWLTFGEPFFGIAGLLWLMLYAAEHERAAEAQPQKVDSSSILIPYEEPDVVLLKEEVASRVKEAADFKTALERKNEEIRGLRSSLNRADLKAVNEGVAAFLLAAEFLTQRIHAGKESPENALPQLMEATDELLAAAGLKKGLPKPGDRLADLPAGSCTVFDKIPSPTPELKGTLVDIRNSWVGFMSGEQLVILSPSRVSVYV